MSVKVRVEGLQQVLRNIEQFPKKLQRRILNGALRDSAKPITRATRSLAPRRTGALARSVRPTTVRRGRIGPVMLIHVGVARKFTSVRNVLTPGGKAKMKFKRSEDAYYARFVEFGAKSHTITASGKALKIGNRFYKKVKHPGTPKRLFFTRAIDANAQHAVREFGTKVRERLAAVRSATAL